MGDGLNPSIRDSGIPAFEISLCVMCMKDTISDLDTRREERSGGR